MRQTLPGVPGKTPPLSRPPLRGWVIPVAILVAGTILLGSTAIATLGQSKVDDVSANREGAFHLYSALAESGCQLNMPPIYQGVALDDRIVPKRTITPFEPEDEQDQRRFQVAL